MIDHNKAEALLAQDAINAAGKVIEAVPAYALVGWDDHYALWWVECQVCGSDKFFTESVDAAICARVRHNHKQHGLLIPAPDHR